MSDSDDARDARRLTELDLGGSEEALPQVFAELRAVGLGSTLERVVSDRRKYWDSIRDDVLEISREEGASLPKRWVPNATSPL
ncbi:hypothetical protein JKA73_31060 [Myxococcus xanthus]|uniref:hypothetical protein n=1 Tax=Myxococcus xanthus TaxID=34 RepID=UPI00191702F9|nr:hypothetical protein [Myxococcus xanthus]QQR43434.1 hypothetical protein JKA73_31060 [Myxococcus xanthus]